MYRPLPLRLYDARKCAALNGFKPRVSALTIATAFGVVFWSSFVVIPGLNNTLTLAHFSTRTGWTALVTSLKIATSTALVVSFMTVVQTYLNLRLKVPGSKLMEYIALFGMGVPGTVIGIGYILTLNQQPLTLTGTMFIIIMAILCQYLGVALEAGISKLHQIGPSMEEASWDMGASKAMTFFRVVLPLMGSSFLYSLIFTFMSAMTTISAIIFFGLPGHYPGGSLYSTGCRAGGNRPCCRHVCSVNYHCCLIVIYIKQGHFTHPPFAALTVQTPWED